VNPAVTLALASLRKIRPNDAVIYILLQLSGAVAGALMTKFILNDRIAEGPFSQAGAVGAQAQASAEVGTPALNNILLGSNFAGFVMEALGAFFLVWAICAVAVNPRAARDWAGLAIGLTLAFLVMIGGPLTGGSFNPARFFGPALVANHWDDAWLYLLGPIVGGVLGALVYWYLFVESRIGGGRAAPGAGPTGLRQDAP
jgi:MIP family channel proteins